MVKTQLRGVSKGVAPPTPKNMIGPPWCPSTIGLEYCQPDNVQCHWIRVLSIAVWLAAREHTHILGSPQGGRRRMKPRRSRPGFESDPWSFVACHPLSLPPFQSVSVIKAQKVQKNTYHINASLIITELYINIILKLTTLHKKHFYFLYFKCILMRILLYFYSSMILNAGLLLVSRTFTLQYCYFCLSKLSEYFL